MILGESHEDKQFRNINEETKIEAWIDSLSPEVAAKYGGELGGLVRSGVKAYNDMDTVSTLLVYGQGMVSESHMPERRAVASKAIYAMKKFHKMTLPGEILPEEPTGFTHLDNFLEQEAAFLTHSTDIDEGVRRLELADDARRIAQRIYFSSGPPPILAA